VFTGLRRTLIERESRDAARFPVRRLAAIKEQEASGECRQVTAFGGPGRGPGRVDARAETVRRSLAAAVASTSSLATTASSVNLSASRLRHLFRESFGFPPRTFRSSARFLRAAELLNGSHLTIKEIAAEVGIGSQSYFSTHFRSLFGRSPTAFRRDHIREQTGA
jgi:AraC-like DNA-binding protein